MTAIVRTLPAMLVFWAFIVITEGWRAALVVLIAIVLATATAVLMSAGEEG